MRAAVDPSWFLLRPRSKEVLKGFEGLRLLKTALLRYDSISFLSILIAQLYETTPPPFWTISSLSSTLFSAAKTQVTSLMPKAKAVLPGEAAVDDSIPKIAKIVALVRQILSKFGSSVASLKDDHVEGPSIAIICPDMHTKQLVSEALEGGKTRLVLGELLSFGQSLKGRMGGRENMEFFDLVPLLEASSQLRRAVEEDCPTVGKIYIYIYIYYIYIYSW